MTVTVEPIPEFSTGCHTSQLTQQDFKSLADQLKTHRQIVISFPSRRWIPLYPIRSPAEYSSGLEVLLMGLHQFVPSATFVGPVFSWVTSRDCSDFTGTDEGYQNRVTIKLPG